MFRRLSAHSIAFWSATLLVAGCASHDNARFGGGRGYAARNAGRSSLNHGLPADPPEILPETHFAAGELFESQGEYAKAIDQYKRAVTVNHNFASAYHRLGSALSATGRHEDAADAIEKAVQLKPKNAVFHNNLAYEYMRLQKWDDAEREFKNAVELQPSLARAHVNLALVLAHGGRFDDALEEFKAALPEPDAYYNLGLLYRGQQQYPQAADAFQHVLELNPRFSAARAQIEQVSRLIEAHVAEQRMAAEAEHEPPPADEQRGDATAAKANSTAADSDAALALDAPDGIPQDSRDPGIAEAGTDEETLKAENAPEVEHDLLLSLARLVQVIENESNCARTGSEALSAGQAVEIASDSAAEARANADEAIAEQGPREMNDPCFDIRASVPSDDDLRWDLAAIEDENSADGSAIEPPVEDKPAAAATPCLPLDNFAAVQNAGGLDPGEIAVLCEGYPPEAMVSAAENEPLFNAARGESDGLEGEARRDPWFHDFRNLQGLLAITENEVLCIKDLTRDGDREIAEGPAPYASVESLAKNSLCAPPATWDGAPTEAGAEDSESSSVARVSGPVAPSRDRE